MRTSLEAGEQDIDYRKWGISESQCWRAMRRF